MLLHRDGYLDIIYLESHIYNIHNKNDTFLVEGTNADLCHYIPILTRRSRCFPKKLETLQAVLAFFVQAYNRFGFLKDLYHACHPGTSVPLLFLTPFNSAFGRSSAQKRSL